MITRWQPYHWEPERLQPNVYNVNDIFNVAAECNEFHELFRSNTEELSNKLGAFEPQISNLKGRINQITPDTWYSQAARSLRSVGIIALFALGILTVIPALVSLPWRDKISGIGYKYITFKSQQQANREALEAELETAKAEIRKLKDPLSMVSSLINNSQGRLTINTEQLPHHVPNSKETLDRAKDLMTRLRTLRESVGLQNGWVA